MKSIGRILVLLFLASPCFAIPLEAAEAEKTNLALNRPYTWDPAPSYHHCTDAGDKTQLTDGKESEGYFWTQKETVGWRPKLAASVTIDLGKLEPIGGVTFRTAARAAGVEWPCYLGIQVSNDGKTFREVGDLIELDAKENGPLPSEYSVRRLSTIELETRGRFVRFVIIPTGDYVFCDEVQVFRGPESLLARDPGGKEVEDYKTLAGKYKMHGSLRRRYGYDLTGITKAVESSGLAKPEAEVLKSRLQKQYEAALDEPASDPASFRAILPFNKPHTAMFRTQAALWSELKRPAVSAWVAETWAPSALYGVPPQAENRPMQVHLMRGEYRASALNLACATDQTQTVQIAFEGLPGGATPNYLTVAEVPWTDTVYGKPVTAALPTVTPEKEGWSINVQPGLLRQVWFTWRVQDLAPGEYQGHLLVRHQAKEISRLPVTLTVYPFDFPEKTSLSLGGWSYTNGHGAYGITPENRRAFVQCLQDHFVNAPWALQSVFSHYTFKEDGSIELDTRELDAWLAEWPDAKRYCICLGHGGMGGKTKASFAGAKRGTDEFNRRVATWLSAWVAHLKTKGITPDQLVFLGHDEPVEGGDFEGIIEWVETLRRAEPAISHWTDPVGNDPALLPSEYFSTFDILCPNRTNWLTNPKKFAQHYLEQSRQGRELQFYSCSGPARDLDPYSYYRLQAWHCFAVGGTGSFFWALGDYGYHSSWNEYLASHGPYTPLFIDAKNITLGKRMEAIRESVEDFETLTMLRRATEKAKAQKRDASVVAEAEKWLETAANRVLSAEGASKIQLSAPKDRTIADSVRVEALELLKRLSESAKR